MRKSLAAVICLALISCFAWANPVVDSLSLDFSPDKPMIFDLSGADVIAAFGYKLPENNEHEEYRTNIDLEQAENASLLSTAMIGGGNQSKITRFAVFKRLHMKPV